MFENKLFDLEQRSRNAAPPPGTDRGRTVGIESLSSGESERPGHSLGHIVGVARDADLGDFARVDIEENGVKLRLTVVDTPGYGDFINNDDS